MRRVVADGVVDLCEDLLRRVVLQRGRPRGGHRQLAELLDEAAVLVHDAPNLGDLRKRERSAHFIIKVAAAVILLETCLKSDSVEQHSKKT